MANVFLSYARVDKNAAKMMADFLSQANITVWWDHHLTGGEDFTRVIGKRLDTADCIIVLWSRSSVESDWVLSEARRAISRGCLIPVLLEDVKPPLGLDHLHALDLAEGFRSGTGNGFNSLLRAVTRHVRIPASEIEHIPAEIGTSAGTTSTLNAIDATQGNNPGFFIQEARTEVRYSDWGEIHHCEIYEKYLRVVPERNGLIEVEIWSGSSSGQQNIKLHHTHAHEVEPVDQYHMSSKVAIADARKGKPIEILEKSTRHRVLNAPEKIFGNEAMAHPILKKLRIIAVDRQFVVIHVLYRTEKVSFRADLPDEHRARVDTIKVHEFIKTSGWEVEEAVQVLGTEEGNLQILRWEKARVEAGTDFAISWKWV